MVAHSIFATERRAALTAGSMECGRSVGAGDALDVQIPPAQENLLIYASLQ